MAGKPSLRYAGVTQTRRNPPSNLSSIDSCAGSFSMIAKDSFRTLVITAHAPQESFFDVSAAILIMKLGNNTK
ncbi:MAG: hypothetical protein JRJ43_09550 [Deltaproteobacteria bacterium]|nr:hypothetical protein [Deltaproteobacteria bacterium]MBW1938463.1 hypothetical protein [Deltaproteobacteria bacterium]